MEPDQGRQEPGELRIVLAFVLDLLLSFIGFGYLVGWLTGGLTEDGFRLGGPSALVVFVLVVIYMVVVPRFGGRLFQRLLGTVPRR